MCTVSFIPAGEKVIITSNRDESVNRPDAISPQNHFVNGKNILFPKDPQAGGTWFAIQKDKSVVVLLNGADVKHKHQPPYRLSRGQIVLQMTASDNPSTEWDDIDLNNIEPFTIVLFTEGKLFQLRWNGTEKNKIELDAAKPHFWSSVTLYPEEIRQMRLLWFEEFLKSGLLSEERILEFHQYAHGGDKNNGLVINRNNQVLTHSICQAVCVMNQIQLTYKDLRKQSTNKYHVITI